MAQKLRKMPELKDIVTALLSPKAYPETTTRVELVQTHVSFVFLTDEFAYKIKKPVNFGFLDFSTLEKRRFYCEQEVLLNRRLCPDTYLGVVTINQNKSGIFLLGQGEVIEYAVKMRRLPQDAMMDNLLAQDKVSPEMMSKVAAKLVDFHSQALTSERVNAFGSLETIKTNTNENFTQTRKYIGETISQKQYENIKSFTEEFIRQNASLFQRRLREGRIRDCHGDLHTAHICITNGICIYDCIEFNERFRYGDVASEIAFLAMDLDHYGRADLSRIFVNAYADLSGDKELKKLSNFYKCYRAYVRGKVESFKLDDPNIKEEEKEQVKEVARSYFDLAGSYTRAKPMFLITTGLIGTGKSTLARALAGRLGLEVISSDIVRKNLAGIPPAEHRFEDFRGGIYSADFTRFTYDTMFDTAKDVLTEGGKVILDASFIKKEERLRARKLARETGAIFFILECTLDEDSLKKRLKKRLERGTISDGRWEIYLRQKGEFDPVVETRKNHVIIDSSKPLETNVRNVLNKINEE